MNKEWSSPWNPFNSAKVLRWSLSHLEKFAEEEYPPPPSVDIDPCGNCNYSCIWCNAYDNIHNKSMKKLPPDHLLKLAKFFKWWGVKSACVSGGGEPFLNEGTYKFINTMHDLGLQNGIITNGSVIKREQIPMLAECCRWFGFSVDAGTKETYCKVKGISDKSNHFNTVLQNIVLLTNEIDKKGYKNDTSWKYLLHPLNYNEIYVSACKAKACGIHDFHLRPVGWENLTVVKDKEPIVFTKYMINVINEQIQMCFEDLEDETFRVYGVRHKFNPDFSVKKNFSRCWMIPLIPTFGSDGYVHTCFDMRGREDLKMCKHFPVPEEILTVWNTEKHKKMVREIDINKCPRCTFGAYNEVIEQVIIDDTMTRFFP